MKTIIFILTILLGIGLLAESQTLFIWPVKKMPSYSEVTDFYITTNFLDQNMSATNIGDWNCGRRTYDGHRGIDIEIWPFTWSMMDNNHVAAIAAAPGRVVVVSVNRNNENNCNQPGQDSTGNYIAIRHADSSTSYYFHLRTNSSVVSVGQQVVAGQLLAFVGSSGFSSNPHLHFEVNTRAIDFPEANGLIDPYWSNCNIINATSWWQDQKPYNEPAIVRVMSHGSRPSLTAYDFNPSIGFCRSAEVKNAKASFAPNDSIYIGVAMRDFLQSAGHSFNVKVYNPNGSVLFDETKTSNAEHVKRYYTFDKKLPSNAAPGTYKAEVSFNGSTGVYFFTVNCPPTENVTGFIFGYKGVKVSSTITSTATLGTGSRMLLQAGSQIRLSPGFVAQSGSIMKARINDCNYIE